MARDGARFAAQKRDEATFTRHARGAASKLRSPGKRARARTHPPAQARTPARQHASQRSKNPNRDPPPRAPQNRIFSGKMRRSRTRAIRQTYNRATVVHGAFWHVRNRAGAREDAARNQARNQAAAHVKRVRAREHEAQTSRAALRDREHGAPCPARRSHTMEVSDEGARQEGL